MTSLKKVATVKTVKRKIRNLIIEIISTIADVIKQNIIANVMK
ncbi:MAG TPA: hypothetical protein VNR38_09745 [Ureibacillus sp.]|nr:hypothetical protein [Ureibacillus sp.]